MADAKKADKPRYYHENGKIFDAGVEIKDAEPLKARLAHTIKKNSQVAERDGQAITKDIANFANEILQKEIDEIGKARSEQDAYIAKKPVKK